LRLRDASGEPPVGTVDARSEAFGRGEPAATPSTPASGALPAGNLGVLAYAGRAKSWSPAPRRPRTDRLVITATNVASVTVDMRRARLTCAAAVDVHSDGPIDVVLAGCARMIRWSR
jgi:hypothetical protein